MTFKDMFLAKTTNNGSNLQHVNIDKYLVFDLETVPKYASLNEATEQEQNVWESFCHRKFESQLKDHTVEELFFENAALYPEFNKVVLISAGRIIDEKIVVSSLKVPKDDSESKAIQIFNTLLNRCTNYILSGFNVAGFDIPVLAKKSIKYNLLLPNQLQYWNQKPWERPVFDIFDFWKKDSMVWPSLETVSTFLGCPNPKEGMHGKEVKNYYYVEDDKHKENLNLIKEYCEGDVFTTLCIFQKIYEQGLV